MFLDLDIHIFCLRYNDISTMRMLRPNRSNTMSICPQNIVLNLEITRTTLLDYIVYICKFIDPIYI